MFDLVCRDVGERSCLVPKGGRGGGRMGVGDPQSIFKISCHPARSPQGTQTQLVETVKVIKCYYPDRQTTEEERRLRITPDPSEVFLLNSP